MLVSGDDFITDGIDSFKPTIMKKKLMPLYSSPSSSEPIIFPQKYFWLFCKYILYTYILRNFSFYTQRICTFNSIDSATTDLLQ